MSQATISIAIRAGLGMCGVRLEALLRGPIQWRVQTFEEGHQVIKMVEIMSDMKERGEGVMPI